MTRRGWLVMAGGVLAGAAVPGCSDAPRAIQTAKAIESETADVTVELPKGKPPAQSDPAAARVVADAIAAHTGGRPERLDRLRSVRLTRSGSFVNSDPPQTVKAEVRAVWPDRYRTELELVGQPRITVCRSGGTVWRTTQALGAQKEPIPLGPTLQGTLADTSYEWLGLLVPLADPDLVAATVADAVVNGKPAAGVWLSSKNLSRAVAHFDKASKELVQFTYEGTEADLPIPKEVRVVSMREVNGVRLPDKLRIKWAGRSAVEWSLGEIEFPVTFPPKLFDEP